MNIHFLQGNALHIPLKDQSVHMVVTSPPYYEMRDYESDGQIGLEKSVQEHIEKLVDVFREVKRVLRDDGSMWVNVGDSYALKNKDGYKIKDLRGIPWLLALALQADGWWLRCDVIWNKTNGMPENPPDRPTRTHEYVFLFSKSEKYSFDLDAIREPYTEPMNRWGGQLLQADGESTWDEGTGQDRYRERDFRPNPLGRNKRSIWDIPTEPYPGAHFAPYPTKLVEPCILASTSEMGCCPICGAQWARVLELQPNYQNRQDRGQPEGINPQVDSTGWKPSNVISEHWKATCDHNADPVPCIVFDPFSGTGTTAVTANRLNRRSIMMDLSWKYMKLAKERTGLKALEEWENGIPATVEADLSDLPMFQ